MKLDDLTINVSTNDDDDDIYYGQIDNLKEDIKTCVVKRMKTLKGQLLRNLSRVTTTSDDVAIYIDESGNRQAFHNESYETMKSIIETDCLNSSFFGDTSKQLKEIIIAVGMYYPNYDEIKKDKVLNLLFESYIQLNTQEEIMFKLKSSN